MRATHEMKVEIPLASVIQEVNVCTLCTHTPRVRTNSQHFNIPIGSRKSISDQTLKLHQWHESNNTYINKLSFHSRKLPQPWLFEFLQSFAKVWHSPTHIFQIRLSASWHLYADDTHNTGTWKKIQPHTHKQYKEQVSRYFFNRTNRSKLSLFYLKSFQLNLGLT